MSVNPVYVLDLAAQNASWAAVRQAVVTGNIANANTRGYTARDVEPFSAVLANTSNDFTLVTTRPGHINASGDTGGTEMKNWEVKDTGAPVKLDSQLLSADDTSRAYSLDTAITRAFNRMLLASVRSGA